MREKFNRQPDAKIKAAWERYYRASLGVGSDKDYYDALETMTAAIQSYVEGDKRV
jgi:hypothetical protein